MWSINKLLNFLPEKKLSLRVRHYSQDYYILEYSYHRWFPNWKSIDTWYGSSSFDDILESWHPTIGPYEEIESAAARFNTVEKLEAHFAREVKARDDYYHRKVKYLARTRPYGEKILL